MKGLELSEKFYNECGKPMLEKEFPELLKYIAVGDVGSGSDRMGFDDDISKDHDFDAGFCIFIPDESIIDDKTAFKLERAYAKLPKEFMGVKRQILSPVGGNRKGVIRTSDFYREKVGDEKGELSLSAWLSIPSFALLEATDGKVFFDGYGEFTKIREKLKNMPEDVKRKRLAGNVLVMAQSGQYNFFRAIKRGEIEAAELSCGEFVSAALKTLFLLENKYQPYYKWSFKAARSLSNAGDIPEKLSAILLGDLRSDAVVKEKSALIEEVSADLISRLVSLGLSKSCSKNLEDHAYSVNDSIKDASLRNMSIFSGI